MQSSVDVSNIGLIAKSRVSEVIQMLTKGDFQAQWETAKQFSELGPEVVAPLIAVAQDTKMSWEVRWFAVRTLGDFSQPQVIAALTELMVAEEDEELCALASQTLAAMGPDAIESLSQLLEIPEQRVLAVQALSRIRRSAVIVPLLTVVADSDATVRYLAVEALSSFHDPKVTDVLLKALEDPASAIRREAIKALGRRPDLCDDYGLIDRLVPYLWDIDLGVCQSAVLALGHLRDEAAVAPLQRLLLSITTPESLKVDAVRALSWLQSSHGLKALAVSFSQVSLMLQQEIVQVLGQVTVPSLQTTAVNILLNILHSSTLDQKPVVIKQRLALSLGNLQCQEAFKPLVGLLADPHSGVQFHGIAALKQIAGEEAEAKLQQLLVDPSLPQTWYQGIRTALATW